MTPVFEVPNLDDMDPADLREVSQVLDILQHYAQQKVLATSRRLTGDVIGAVRIERVLERIYQTLPQQYRW